LAPPSNSEYSPSLFPFTRPRYVSFDSGSKLSSCSDRWKYGFSEFSFFFAEHRYCFDDSRRRWYTGASMFSPSRLRSKMHRAS
jgi:hypothetical protein